MADLEQREFLPLRPAPGAPDDGFKQHYSGISASDHARQQNGNIYNNNTGHSASGDARQYMGDVTNNTTYNYSVRKRKSDDTLREDGRNRAFLSASAEGQAPRVRHLLRLGVDLDYSDDDGFTALHHACLSGFEDVVQILLDAGVDINARSLDLGTPLCLAVLREREKVVKLLLSSRADVNKEGQWVGSPLHCASWAGSLAITETLLAHGAIVVSDCAVQVDYYDFTSRSGFPVALKRAAKDSCGFHTVWECTALHIAAFRGHEGIIEHLLKAGCPVDAESRVWDTPDPAMLSLEEKETSKFKRYSAYTGLMEACTSGHCRIASRLIKAGAVVDKVSSIGFSALHVSAQRGSVDCARVLVQAGSTVDSVDCDLQTPLFLAALEGQVPVAEYLLQMGAKVDAQGRNRWTPCHVVAVKGHQDVFEILLKHGADVSKRDEDGRTPLHLSSCAEISQRLLDAGANVADRGHDGSTALHYAAYQKHVDVVKVLLEYGADASVRDKIGRTAREYVTDGDLELCKILPRLAPVQKVRSSGVVKASVLEKHNDAVKRTRDPKPNENADAIIKCARVEVRRDNDRRWTKGEAMVSRDHLEILKRGSSADGSLVKIRLDELGRIQPGPSALEHLRKGKPEFWTLRFRSSPDVQSEYWTLRFETWTELAAWWAVLSWKG